MLMPWMNRTDPRSVLPQLSYVDAGDGSISIECCAPLPRPIRLPHLR